MPTILIAAGGIRPPSSIAGEIPPPDRVVAADGGYDLATGLGFSVDVLIGDMDSIRDGSVIGPETEVIRHPEDKDATDLELAFEYSLRARPERIVLIGGEGGRVDHEVSTLAVLASERWSEVPEVDWIRSDGVLHVVRGTRRIHGDVGALVSLIAAHGDAVSITTTGLEWNLSNSDLHAGSSLGTSNRFARPTATISVEFGVAYVIVPTAGSKAQAFDD